MIRAGTVLAGRYRLEDRIASGGMGEVWRASDKVLGRTVAVKCMLAAPPDEPSFVGRFRDEARTMATISHPGVVEVYDFGDDPSAGVYLVMKHIEGESLAHTLGRVGRLSPETTMRLVAEAAEALQAAHEKGVTHRDVKPGNLLVRPDGKVLLTDFGIARAAGSPGHTNTGLLVGTAEYIAPERANGHPATARSDIYSLGVVAYRCLAGRLPFTGDSLVDIALQHVYDEPPPLPAEVPGGVRAIVARAMAKDPADRWPTAGVFAVEARHALHPGPTQRPGAAPAGLPQRRPSGAVSGMDTSQSAPWAASETGASQSGPWAASENGASQSAPWAASETGASRLRPSGAAAGTGLSPFRSPTADSADDAGVATVSPPEQATVTTAMPTGVHPVSHARRTRWLLLPVAATAVAVAAVVAAVLVVLNRGGDPQAIDPQGGPSAYGGAGAGATPAVSQGPTLLPPSLAVTTPTATPAATNKKTGTSTTPPAAPANLTATPVGSGAIRLRWADASSDEEGFTITNGVTSSNTGANATSFDWTGLPPSTRSCFKVRAFNTFGVSAYHPAAEPDWVCATSSAGSGPAAPGNLTVSEQNPNTVLLQWTDRSSNEDGFTVTDGVTSRNAPANATGMDWHGLNPGTYICFKVRSFNSSGVSGYYPAAEREWVCITTSVT